MAKRSGLGKGLGALFSDMDDVESEAEVSGEEQKKPEKAQAPEKVQPDKIQAPNKTQAADINGNRQFFDNNRVTERTANNPVEEPKRGSNQLNQIVEIDINKIFPNPEQPRKNFDKDALKELSNSIRIHGVIQPIVVVKRDEKFMIIAGERRWRASLDAGLMTVPAVVRLYSGQLMREVSLIENLQREDLNVIEAAYAIQALMEIYGFNQNEVADRLGKSRPAIANTIRLLSLESKVMDLVRQGRLSAGHARCLVVIGNPDKQYELAKASCDNKITVRELERLVKEYMQPTDENAAPVKQQSPELKDLVVKFTRVLGTRVAAVGNDNKGRLYIDYFTRDDLERISAILLQESSK